MCILYTLKALDKEKRALLEDDAGENRGESITQIGMELLQKASRSSRLASRYVASLQHIYKVQADGNSQHLAEQHASFPTPQSLRSDLDDPVMEAEFSFTDLDGLLLSTGLPGDPSIGLEGNHSVSDFISW